MIPEQIRALTETVGGLREMFAADGARARRGTVEACGIRGDFSRQLIDVPLFEAVVAHMRSIGLEHRIEAMFSGASVNTTEGRPALHVASRARGSSLPQARESAAWLAGAMELADSVRSGSVVSSTGEKFATVVHIGIGGSDLGPRMVVRGLRRFCDGPEVRFVSNVDPADLDRALTGLEPATTLVVVSSKTFTTVETLRNADRARRWIEASCPDWRAHFVATTAHADAAEKWGVDPSRCLRFGEWVGGRFSVSSTIGFPVMCATGSSVFSDFLDGMHDLDDHFLHAPLESNLPVVHALVWWLNTAVRGLASVAVVPYASDLALFPAHLQQLVMESNGKGTNLAGDRVHSVAAPVVFGEPGTDAQHSFFQLLHQGAQVVPVDFIGVVEPMGSDAGAHDLLIANMLAQSDALATGRSLGETEAAVGAPDPHRSFPGDRPSTVLFLSRLDARHLGALLALYEHSVFVQSVLSDVNCFDQFGVELGKTVATSVSKEIDGGEPAGLTLTHPLLEWYVSQRDEMTRNGE